MKNKTIIIISSIVVVLAIIISIAYHYSFVVPKEAVAERCQNYVPNWENFVECYGVVVVTDAWDEDYLSLKDHIHDYEVARVYNQNQYRYVDGKVFVINRNNIEKSSSNGSKTTYYQALFRNNKVIEKSYDSISDIPVYLVIDTKSGEVQDYKKINEVPQSEQDYFKEIEAK